MNKCAIKKTSTNVFRHLAASFLLCSFFLSGCYRVGDRIEPKVDFCVQETHFARLESPFPPLNIEERRSDWGREMFIAQGFSRELDLYRAVSTFKRAKMLIDGQDVFRKTQIEYDIFLCYYLGKRYEEALDAVNRSSLANVDRSFPAYHDLLLIMGECYHEMCCSDKEERIHELIQVDFPETARRLNESQALRSADLEKVRILSQEHPESPYLADILACYAKEKKSVGKAQGFNALLPGAGYYYLGQKKTALTAFLLNGLFIAAAYEFFHRGNVAAGIITSSFEAGWYFGGIYGAGQEAKYYNERLYERQATRLLDEKNLFPALMMHYSF